jgi:hypothetical protein
VASKVKLTSSAFGVATLQAKKIEKLKSDKVTMNEQNWNLKQDADQYIPQKLPFFKTEQGLIKPVSTAENLVSDLFMGDKANEHEAMLV